MANGVVIEGLDDALSAFDNAPTNCLKVTRDALKEGSKAAARLIRSRTPSRWRPLVRYAIAKDQQGNLVSFIGYYNKHVNAGHQNKNTAIDDWFKAYWRNYGTLTKRDSQHHFKYAIKHDMTAAAQSRKNQVGQPPQKFFERAMQGYEQAFESSFTRTFQDRADQLLKK